MSYRSLLQLLILVLVGPVRQVYYELMRDRITDRRRFGYGDGAAILLSLFLAFWTAINLYLIAITGATAPSEELVQTLRWGLALSILLPGLLLGLTRLLRLWLGNFLAGFGRGLISFGLAVTLLSLYCWLP